MNLKVDSDKMQWIKSGMTKLWSRFAEDFINENFSSEYNCLKHGLRAKSGGFQMFIGREDTPGVMADPEKMEYLGGSEFGSSYFWKEYLNKVNFRPRRHSHNWNPHSFVHGLNLLAMSIGNVVSFLQALNNNNSSGNYNLKIPETEDILELPWIESPDLAYANFDYDLNISQINPFSRDEIRKSYSKTEASSGS